MVKIKRNVAVRKSYEVGLIDIGVFFEFESKLYITLRSVGPGKSDIRCYDISEAISVDLPYDSIIYLCKSVEIKYDLFDPEGV